MCDLVGCVRLEHVLPLGGEESVRQAAARGILTRSWAPGGFGQNTARGQEFGTQHWDPRIFRWVRSSLFIDSKETLLLLFRPSNTKPRLFLPYYEACKSLISDNIGGVTGDSSSFNFHRMSADVPDTLYMVRDDPRELGAGAGGQRNMSDQDNVSHMVQRVRRLYRTISVQRALVSPFCNKQQILLQLQLR